MKQSLYFVCADGGTIRFIIDIKEINFAFFHRYNNSKSDDPCATTFTLSFGGDLHTNFAETTSKVDTESGILCQFIKECGIVICDGCVVFTKPLDFFIERFGCFYSIIHDVTPLITHSLAVFCRLSCLSVRHLFPPAPLPY